MRCNICNKILEQQEVYIDKFNQWAPCGKCVGIAWQATADDELHQDLHEAVLIVTEEQQDE